MAMRIKVCFYGGLLGCGLVGGFERKERKLSGKKREEDPLD